MIEKVSKNDEEWQWILTPQQYEITQNKDTEPPFTGKHHNFKEKGRGMCSMPSELQTTSSCYEIKREVVLWQLI
jgi:peptide methionine sulfoxide reductase MsrB